MKPRYVPLLILASLATVFVIHSRAYDGTVPKDVQPHPLARAGLSSAEFAQVDKAMMETSSTNPELRVLDAKIRDLIDERVDLLFRATLRAHPELAESLSKMQAMRIPSPVAPGSPPPPLATPPSSSSTAKPAEASSLSITIPKTVAP